MLLDFPRDSVGFNSKMLNYPTEDIMMRSLTKNSGGMGRQNIVSLLNLVLICAMMTTIMLREITNDY